MNEGPAGWGAPLHAHALDGVGAGPGTRLLVLGCGGGAFSRAAADRGAAVTGIDADPSAVAAAATLVPEGEFRVGDAHEPPDGPFDVAAAVQLLSHVTDPVRVMRMAVEVAPVLLVTLWGREQECDVRAFGEALAPWLPPRTPPPGPDPITEPTRLLGLADLAGWRSVGFDEVVCPFHYPDEDALLGPLFESGIGRHALNRAGPAAVRTAVLDRLAEHRTPEGWTLNNTFRVLRAVPRT